jgi:hypothetical protein
LASVGLQATSGFRGSSSQLAISIPSEISVPHVRKTASGMDVACAEFLSDFEQAPYSEAAAVRFKTSSGFRRIERFGSEIIDLVEWHGGC